MAKRDGSGCSTTRKIFRDLPRPLSAGDGQSVLKRIFEVFLATITAEVLLLRKALAVITALVWPRMAAAQSPSDNFWTMNISDLVTILAVLLAPIIAIQVQWRLQLRRERRDRKVWIFKTLMATRATATDAYHVQALNMIDVEFDGKTKKDVGVRTAWKIYLDHLNTPLDWTKAEDSEKKAWADKTSDLLASLLHSMGLGVCPRIPPAGVRPSKG